MIAYQEGADGVSPADLEGFFVGWPAPPSPERHLAHLRACDRVVLAREGERGRVVGFVSALTDGVLAASVPLLEVLPEFQGRGIGSELVRRLLGAIGDLYMVDLACDPELEPFYARLGLGRVGVALGVRRREPPSRS